MKKIIAFLQLTRPANLITSVADILAGIALGRFFIHQYDNHYDLQSMILLCISTIGLYGGGVVMNDVFDAALDKIERPERPIPSGRASKEAATLLAIILFIIAIICAAFISTVSVLFAGCIILFALLYDKYAKPHFFWGPLLMGICRGLNLLLGISIIGQEVFQIAYLGIIPVIYIFAVTSISRGEVHGGHLQNMRISFIFYVGVVMAILIIAALHKNFWITVPAIILLAVVTLIPLVKAMREPAGTRIGKAVKSGVLAIIILDAAWALASGNIVLAIVILCCLPVSLLLAKIFAVT